MIFIYFHASIIINIFSTYKTPNFRKLLYYDQNLAEGTIWDYDYDFRKQSKVIIII